MREFDEYKRLGEPEKKEKSENWSVAVGLQQTDGLTTSKYLIKTAKENIDGKITIYEVKERLNDHYKAKPLKKEDDRTEEADKVSARIAEILSERTFKFSPAEYITIHKRLFTGIYRHAGKIRDYNISKAEWVLNGETVLYASADSIKATLDYDFSQEKEHSYKGSSKEEFAKHIAKFVSGIWQIHAFGEGNTRTTAVFAIKYLRALGFDATNDMFTENSWYFRNALVRANYNDHKKGISSSTEYLDHFFGNLLLNEKNVLKNRDMLVSACSGAAGDTANYTVKHGDTVKRQNDTVNDTVKWQDYGENDTVKPNVDTVFSLIKNTPNITAAKLAERTGRGIATVKREIRRLKECGAIERIGSDKAGRWKILKDVQ